MPNVMLRRWNAAGTQDGEDPLNARYNCQERGNPPGVSPHLTGCILRAAAAAGEAGLPLAGHGGVCASVGPWVRSREVRGMRGARPPKTAPPSHREGLELTRLRWGLGCT